jgi:hypothetical protein
MNLPGDLHGTEKDAQQKKNAHLSIRHTIPAYYATIDKPVVLNLPIFREIHAGL